MVNQEFGYLELPYLTNTYLTGVVLAQQGQQMNIIINDDFKNAQQANIDVSTKKSTGQQLNLTIESPDDDKSLGQQYNLKIDSTQDDKFLGQQLNIDNSVTTSQGQQSNIIIQGIDNSNAMSTQLSNMATAQHASYLNYPYLTEPYLNAKACTYGSQQANFKVIETNEIAQQVLINIISPLDDGFIGQQQNIHVFKQESYAMQTDFLTTTQLAMQLNISLYNTTNLRILCDFASRGFNLSSGLNAWGNASGTGKNWKSNSTEAGDFEVYRLNTDITDEVWRGANNALVGINLDCDTEKPQGIFLDTLAILNTNITTSANISLIGSSSSTFSTIGVSIPLPSVGEDKNIFYVAPELPSMGFKYWRIAIDDQFNPDGFISIGTVIFGSARIFFGECFVDEVGIELKDYTDSVQTEAFTNIKNSRAQRKILDLDFRSLDYSRGNFKLMRSVFQNARTVLKCLWIPTPNPTNHDATGRFAVFAKMKNVPRENHKTISDDADYVSFNVQLDEAD